MTTAQVGLERLTERAFEKIRWAGRGMPAIMVEEIRREYEEVLKAAARPPEHLAGALDQPATRSRPSAGRMR